MSNVNCYRFLIVFFRLEARAGADGLGVLDWEAFTIRYLPTIPAIPSILGVLIFLRAANILASNTTLYS